MSEPTSTTDHTGKESFQDLRVRMGLSRREAADLVKLSQAVVWRLEQAYFDPDTVDDESKDKANAVSYWDALMTFAVANPEGKPRKAPKPRTVAKPDYTEVITDLKKIVILARGYESQAKEKSVASGPYAQLATMAETAVAKYEAR